VNKVNKVNKVNRVMIVVLDGCGVGEMPDAADYGDAGSNTFLNTAAATGGLKLPCLQALGLGNVISIPGVPPVDDPRACYGKMAELSAGKDTTVGHWEIMGLVTERPFPVYPAGFPDTIIITFEKAIGRKILGNKPASGTEIIAELGEEHLKTGNPIVYTSQDSVFQIAAHEDMIDPDELYGMCRTARKILTGPDAVARVIARPFVGSPGAFKRTAGRKDFSLPPHGKTVLDFASEEGITTYAVGKTAEIFDWQGIDVAVKTTGNMDTIDAVIGLMERSERALIISTLTDFDMLWGHRNDVEGFKSGLEAVDTRLPELIRNMRTDDVLILTADHGCDPTTSSTDHSREYVPLLILGDMIRTGVDLGIRDSFSDIAKTVSDLMDLDAEVNGASLDVKK